MTDLANTGEAGTAAARAMFGHFGEVAVTLLILLAMLGCVNGSILTGSRISFAMAEQGDCVAPAGRVSKRYGTPAVALWLQCGWTIVLVVTHGFEDLVKYASAAMLITGTLTVMAVVILRRKLPETPRPYRTWGYPFTPAAFAVSSLIVLAILAHELDPSVFLGGGWFVVALLFHRFVLRPRRASLPREAAAPWRDARPS
jgi:APA family basic amino acid/polyamine antiporter